MTLKLKNSKKDTWNNYILIKGYQTNIKILRDNNCGESTELPYKGKNEIITEKVA